MASRRTEIFEWSFAVAAVLSAAVLSAASPALADGGSNREGASLPVERMRKAVVAVRATLQDTDWKTPWKKVSPSAVEFNGIVAEGRVLLVPGAELNAYTLVEVQKLGQQEWWPAKVKLVDWEVPIALLEVEDATFWAGLEPLPLSAVVPAAGTVQLARWESGKFEVSSASVSQLESETTSFGRMRSLQIHLTTTATTSILGEAVLAGEQVIGMVSRSAKDYMTAFASPFLSDFLREAGHQPYRGFGRLGVYWQALTNPSLREYLGLRPEDGGVLIVRVLPQGGGGFLPLDVVLEVDGHQVDASGRYENPHYGPLRWSALWTEGKHPGEVMNVVVLRERSRQTLRIPVKRSNVQDDRIPRILAGERPDYAIEGGLVFQHLSLPYLSANRSPALRLNLAVWLEFDQPTPEHPKVVVLTSVLPDPANVGYQELHDLMVEQVNGIPVRNLADLRVAFTKPIGPNHIVEFLRIVLDAVEFEAAAQRIKLD
jgi:hypothetical protein